MATHLLDTNTVPYLADPTSAFHQRVAETMQAVPGEGRFAISLLTLHELAYGYVRDPGYSRLLAIVREESLALLGLSEASAEVFARLKNAYRLRTGARDRELVRHNIDLILASTAVVEGAVLVSNDRIFRALAELEPLFRVEDWTV